ncbi:hypothetical protein ACRQ4K_10560, partial [Corynebacterium striatum]|uniref:hypothetical protein n=1 Tax=Corynebacterium striatum TaxID=43770 RepID=UPI003D7B80C4
GGKTGYRAATATPVPGTALPVPKTSPRQYTSLTSFYLSAQKGRKLFIFDEIPKIESVGGLPHHE